MARIIKSVKLMSGVMTLYIRKEIQLNLLYPVIDDKVFVSLSVMSKRHQESLFI